jgi:hypothetical protein
MILTGKGSMGFSGKMEKEGTGAEPEARAVAEPRAWPDVEAGVGMDVVDVGGAAGAKVLMKVSCCCETEDALVE